MKQKHCHEIGQEHKWAVKAVTSAGIWRDCKDCGTTGLLLEVSLNDFRKTYYELIEAELVHNDDIELAQELASESIIELYGEEIFLKYINSIPHFNAA